MEEKVSLKVRVQKLGKYGYAQYWSIYCLGSIDCPLYR